VSAERYFMPAEWNRHAGTLLAWPHQTADWPGKFAPIPWVYGEIVRHLAGSERVIIAARGPLARRARGVLAAVGADLSAVSFLDIATDRVWTRDSGPIGVRDDRENVVLLDWRFNAWAKYDNFAADDRLPEAVATELSLPTVAPNHNGARVVLEGGAIDVNGKGLLLTTEECLLSDVQCRNPGFTAHDYEAVFDRYLGIDRVIWLSRGIVGDDTHGHVDDLARFVSEDVVVLAEESDPLDPNYAILNENRERLSSAPGIEVVSLPMPRPVVFRKQRLPASYANFYIGNDVVLVPTFNDPADRLALGILGELFPGRRVIGIHSVDLVWGLGTLHCLSQQLIA
jgi:agmatine deiminase